MLTPAFELFQDKTCVTIVIRAPFTKVSETEIFIEECDFKFYSKPYFLRLNLPGQIVEDGRETADYDAEKGTYTIKVPKKNPGEVFEGLDMLTKLLAPKGQNSARLPLIEVMGDKTTLPSDQLPDEEADWSVDQTVETESDSLLSSSKYGFGCLRSNVFSKLQLELLEVVDVKDPDSLSPNERTAQRMAQEDSKFDDDHYLADLYQDDYVQELLSFNPPWNEHWKQLKASAQKDQLVTLTEEEKEKIRKMPNKEYLIDSCHLQSTFFSLIDIIFAYAFTFRVTEGDFNVESGWSICKLSPTLSWLEEFKSLKDVLVGCYRRCLCFPLHRHWALIQTVREDTFRILSLGRTQVLKCLLDINKLLTDTDQRYILNDLYINDYCVWIQGVRNDKLLSLAEELQKVTISKSEVGFSLVELEAAAAATLEEEEAGGIVGKLNSLTVTGEDGNDSDDATDSDDVNTESDDESTETDTSDDDNRQTESPESRPGADGFEQVSSRVVEKDNSIPHRLEDDEKKNLCECVDEKSEKTFSVCESSDQLATESSNSNKAMVKTPDKETLQCDDLQTGLKRISLAENK